MPGKRRALEKSTPMGALVDKLERAKARIRAKVEHPPRVIKRQYGYIRASTGDQSKHSKPLERVCVDQSVHGTAQSLAGAAGMSAPAIGPRGE